ncbi:S-adenosylmethionine synthetase [Halobacteriales archaeon SW_12_67_38]|nr:MAG: S-adenosylmethionine synthetase [Halobacteriales archaeon SW_12_67_38]
MTERNVSVAALDRPAVDDQTVEIVERKGIGHPDSLCDGIAESVSRALAAAYLDRVGTILHYNTDETQLVAGNAAPAFGGGEVIEPIHVLIVGRATSEYEGTTIPTEPIALRAARQYLDAHVPHLDVGTDVVLDAKLGEGSGDLREVFDGDSVPMANDTSFGVGHAPLSETEEIVLATERRLNGEYATDNPELGADIKVMGKREGDRIDVTVAAAMIDAHIESLEAYTDAVDGVREYVTDLAREYTDREVDVRVNTADDYDEGSIYLTTTGTSAEQGDDGSVGTSGKNPVNHIGKLYNLLSTEIAESVVREVEGIRDLRVRLVSRIGQPVDQPHVADIHVSTASGVALGDVESAVARIVDRELGDLTDVTRRAVDGEISTF